MRRVTSKPDFSEEKRLWKKGCKIVIGVDEVGRGAFAGMVTVGAVCFDCFSGPNPKNITNAVDGGHLRGRANKDLENYLQEIGIDDSKLLKPEKRKRLAKEIRETALGFSVASSSVAKINSQGIKKAAEKAFRKAVKTIRNRLDRLDFLSKEERKKVFVLSDGFCIRYLRGVGLKNQKAITKGDQKSLSIASASILAKVRRDQFMVALAKNYPKYGWEKNKGYGTTKHQKAILRYGLTKVHRQDFVETFLENHNT